MPLQTSKKYTVYSHTDPETGLKYIGITSQNPERRWQKGLGYVKNKEFYGLIKKRGWDNLKHKILKDGLDGPAALEMEQRLIKRYHLQDKNKGINMRAGGFSNAPSDDIKHRIAQTLMGHEVSEETRSRIRDAIPSRGVYQLSPDGKRLKKFRSLSEAARAVSGLKPNIWAVANGHRKSYKGYGWEYER